ncbi:unnamed protein product [Pylaiella littoralis]
MRSRKQERDTSRKIAQAEDEPARTWEKKQPEDNDTFRALRDAGLPRCPSLRR